MCLTWHGFYFLIQLLYFAPSSIASSSRIYLYSSHRRHRHPLLLSRQQANYWPCHFSNFRSQLALLDFQDLEVITMIFHLIWRLVHCPFFGYSSIFIWFYSLSNHPNRTLLFFGIYFFDLSLVSKQLLPLFCLIIPYLIFDLINE